MNVESNRIIRVEELERLGITVEVVQNREMKRIWQQVEIALHDAFDDAVFSEGFNKNSPIEHTLAGVKGEIHPYLGHIIARKESGEIVGGILCVPLQRQENEEDYCDVGWFFTTKELDRQLRKDVVAEMVITAFDVMREAGYGRIVTKMGTPAGANALSKHFGFSHKPEIHQSNRYVRDL